MYISVHYYVPYQHTNHLMPPRRLRILHRPKRQAGPGPGPDPTGTPPERPPPPRTSPPPPHTSPRPPPTSAPPMISTDTNMQQMNGTNYANNTNTSSGSNQNLTISSLLNMGYPDNRTYSTDSIADSTTDNTGLASGNRYSMTTTEMSGNMQDTTETTSSSAADQSRMAGMSTASEPTGNNDATESPQVTTRGPVQIQNNGTVDTTTAPTSLFSSTSGEPVDNNPQRNMTVKLKPQHLLAYSAVCKTCILPSVIVTKF